MIDFTSSLGQRAAQRLGQEFVIWLTTVSSTGVPHPRPVWFIWDGQAFLIYSQAKARKLQHIRDNPRVALHFDGGQKGEDIQVFLGKAELLNGHPLAHQVDAYIQKYAGEVKLMGATPEAFAGEYSVAIRMIPDRLRGIG